MLRNWEKNMNDPVLLLNANYQPLNVCSTKRAVGLLMMGKAEMLHNGRGYIKTVRISVPRPSVIRLGYMVKRPRERVKLTKQEIFRRDNLTCQYCAVKARGLTIDHVKPRHRGGEHSWTNLVAACPDCNRKKGGRTIREARMNLIKLPKEPKPTAIYLYGSYLSKNDDWRNYLQGW
jgi:5-methylcytosine-specific restriction endonuclease McrA